MTPLLTRSFEVKINLINNQRQESYISRLAQMGQILLIYQETMTFRPAHIDPIS